MTEDQPTQADAAAATEAAPRPRRRGSLAGKLLTALVLLAAGWALAVWQSPKFAPLLPPEVARWITPQGVGGGLDGEALEARIGALERRLAAAEGGAEAATGLRERVAALADDLAALDASVAEVAARPVPEPAPAAPDPALLDRLARAEQTLAALDAAVAAAKAGEGRTQALAADLAALDEEVSALSEAVEAADDQPDIGDLPDRVAALETARQQQEEFFALAREEAMDNRRAVDIATALASIDRAMTLGAPFPEALAELSAAAGEPAPAPLPEAAEHGAPTREALKASFPAAAHDAIAAALVSEAGADSEMRSVLARLQARVTGLPTEPTPGDSAPAVLSRARHALLNGDLDAALASIDALPDAAKDAMADWIADARLRSAADHALAAWRAQIKMTL